MSIPNNNPRLAPLATITVATLLLGGCVDYRNHREGITLAAGDAIHWNQAVHTIDPWPPGVFDTDIPDNGKRTEAVIQKYENPPAAAEPTNVTINVGDNAGATNPK